MTGTVRASLSSSLINKIITLVIVINVVLQKKKKKTKNVSKERGLIQIEKQVHGLRPGSLYMVGGFGYSLSKFLSYIHAINFLLWTRLPQAVSLANLKKM